MRAIRADRRKLRQRSCQRTIFPECPSRTLNAAWDAPDMRKKITNTMLCGDGPRTSAGFFGHRERVQSTDARCPIILARLTAAKCRFYRNRGPIGRRGPSLDTCIEDVMGMSANAIAAASFPAPPNSYVAALLDTRPAMERPDIIRMLRALWIRPLQPKSSRQTSSASP